MPDAKPAPAAGDPGRQFLTFRMDSRVYAVAAEDVSEVIRAPAVARVPQSPQGLLGLANLRGAVLPIASLRGLLGQPQGAPSERDRVIVLTGASPIGLSVDTVDALVRVAGDEIETRQAELAREPGEALAGAFRAGAADVAKILDLPNLLARAFAPRARSGRGGLQESAPSLLRADEGAQVGDEKLVTFEVSALYFAIFVESVREIVEAPRGASQVPHSEALVLGVMGYRDTLLPLLSLRGLLGFASVPSSDGGGKVIVTAVGGVLVGLVADRMRDIVPADPALIEVAPPMLAARAGGETQIKAIYRGDGGRRLISILAADLLFREDVMARLGSADATPAATVDAAVEGEALRILVFRLGDDEFGLPIEVVDEVARSPDQITRLPKTPRFLEGVVNLRGEVLPVIDQRRRFDMPPLAQAEGRRLIVVRTKAHRAGLIVDSVSEVLRSTADQIRPAPALAGEATRLVNGVLNLEKDGRLVLMLDPDELLSRAERGLLEAFQARAEQAET